MSFWFFYGELRCLRIFSLFKILRANLNLRRDKIESIRPIDNENV